MRAGGVPILRTAEDIAQEVICTPVKQASFLEPKMRRLTTFFTTVGFSLNL